MILTARDDSSELAANSMAVPSPQTMLITMGI